MSVCQTIPDPALLCHGLISQLYHHCIYGIRHDFLCANFTAFDQKTFICQFVSEVNCKASPKYFFRNDALYVAATTTSTTTTTLPPPVTQPQPQYNDRPLRPRRPLLRPRRPTPAQNSDYYYDDDEYEQDDYVEEQRYTRRRQQAQRGRTRRPTEYEDEYAQSLQGQQLQGQGRRFADDAYDRRPQRNRNKPAGYEYDEDEEPAAVRPRPRNGNRPRNQQVDDRDRFENAPQPQRPATGGRKGAAAQSQQPAPRRKPAGRPKPQRYDDEDESDYDDRPAAPPSAQVSPTGGGSALFSRPRAAPRINRPVPLSDKRKYEYKTTTTTASPADDGYDAEYEEDYDEPAPVPVSNTNDRSASTLYNRRAPPPTNKKPSAAKKPLPPTPVYEDEENDEEEDVPSAPTRTQYKPAASTSPRKVQSRLPVSPPAVAVDARQKSRRPAISGFSDEQEDEPQSRPRPNRRPVVQAYSGEEDAAADDDVRAPVRINNNQRTRVPLSRPLLATAATSEGRAYSRKAPAAAEIYAEEDEDDQVDVQPAVTTAPPPPAAPARKRPAVLRQKVIVPIVAQPEENINARRPAEENTSSQKFRSQFRVREQPARMTSTTTSTTSTTASPPPPLIDDDEEYVSDEYEDEEPIVPLPAVQAQPPRSALNKNPHRFAAPVPSAVPDTRPTSKLNTKYQTSGRATAGSSSEEYFEPNASEETAAASESAAPPSRQQTVRVVKRPFLPSRGGNPYLPRGLKPLGPVERDVYADEDTTSHLDLGPTISGAKLLEFHPPLVSREPTISTTTSTTTTTSEPTYQHQQQYQQQPLQQQTLDPNRKLEEIFSSELDVTLNDALNPTLKPLSRSSPIGFSFKYSPSYYEPAANRRDATVDDAADLAQQSQIHSAAVQAPFYETTAGGQSRSAPMTVASAADTEFYSDYDY